MPGSPFSTQRNRLPELLSFILCPVSKKKLEYDEEKNLLLSPSIKIAYKVSRSGIPNLIPSEAIPYSEIPEYLDEKRRVRDVLYAKRQQQKEV